jgi:phosphatidate cytidylyltransferase
VSSSAPAKAKSDLPVRTAAALVMIMVAVAAIYFGGWPFRILVALAAVLMLIEFCDMHKLRRFWPLVALPVLVLNLWFLPEIMASTARLSGGLLPAAPTGVLHTTLIALLLGLLARSGRLAQGYLYIAIPSLALLLLNGISWQAVFWAMIVTWSTDIFAYFAGRSIGGPKLAPKISPNKTWAGLIGGMAGAGVLGALAAWLLGLPTVFWFSGAPMGLLAQLGDLYESSMKRKAGVKDSGSILPGHGGVLDRLDGLLPVAVATLLLALAAY